jgi:hypothetical protein
MLSLFLSQGKANFAKKLKNIAKTNSLRKIVQNSIELKKNSADRYNIDRKSIYEKNDYLLRCLLVL